MVRARSSGVIGLARKVVARSSTPPRSIAYPPSTERPRVRHRPGGHMRRNTLRSSMRLLSLGVDGGLHLLRLFERRRRRSTSAPSTRAIGERGAERKASVASAGGGSVDWTACVAFDTGGLGDKGFNDLAKKGLEDAGCARLQDVLLRGAGRDRLRGEHPAPHRPGLPVDRHGRLQPGPGHDRSDQGQPGHRLLAGRRRTLGRDPANGPPARRTSPAWTSRSMRRRCSPATSRRASARPARSAPTAASSSRA